jgi:hypothetical protein
VVDVAAGPDRVYAATLGLGALTTKDGGASWHEPGPGLRTRYPRLVAADPTRAGLAVTNAESTHDGGGAWSSPPLRRADLFDATFAFDPTRPGRVLALARGLFESRDHGATFRRVAARLPDVIPPDRLVAAGPAVVALGPTEDVDADFVDPAGRTLVTRDLGRRWTALLPAAGCADDVAADLAHPHRLLAAVGGWCAGPGTVARPDGVWRSGDDGRSWTRISGRSVTAVAVSRSGKVVVGGTAGRGGQVYALSAHGVLRPLGPRLPGPVSRVVIASGGEVYVLAGGRVYRVGPVPGT